MADKTHVYQSQIVWTGNKGAGTANYADYGRDYRTEVAGKPPLPGSADPIFRGDPKLHNPEDLFVSSIASCHMLTYLALCALKGVVVTGYQDEAEGVLHIDSAGGGRFERIRLRPRVTIEKAQDTELALQLHDAAHTQCFVANSCSAPIEHEATIHTARAAETTATQGAE